LPESPRAHPDGGREMGLIFGVILPGIFVAVAVSLYVLLAGGVYFASAHMP